MTDDARELYLSRRRLLRYGATGAGALTLGQLLAACGNSSTSSSQATSAPPPSSAAPATTAAETSASAATTAASTASTVESETASTAAATGGGGGTLKLAVGDGQAKDSLDPALVITSIPVLGGGMIYDTLLNVDMQWTLSPMLAEDWSASPDGKEWTFKLRQGVEFHTGKTLEASDVAEQFKRVLDKKVGSPGLGILAPVLDPSGIVVGDPTTITFKLKQADGFFGIKVAHYTTRIPQAGTTDWVKGSFGTGPFKNVSFRPSEGFEFARNENYWQDGKPLLDAITCVVIPEQATKAQALLNGDVDVSDPPAVAQIPEFEKSDVATFLKGSRSAYTFDVDSSIKPYADPRVSQAMKMLVDREKMLNIVLRGQGVVSADSLIPPGDPFYPPDLQPFPYDPEKAKALLAQAGLADGFKDKIWTTTAYPYLNEGAAFGKEAWGKANIEMDLQSVSNDRYLSAFLNEPIVMDYYLAQHPVGMFELYYASGSDSNTTRYKDPEIDAWLAELKSTVDEARQQELAHEIVHRYNERAAEIVPFHFDDLWPYKTRVQGLIPHPMMRIDFREASIAS
jgi:peptide/nickel transport system substrate-binding protein